MKRGRSTTTPTKAEAAWLDAVKRTGCICCWLRGYGHDPDGPAVEAHHLLSGGIRRGHLFTVGLCAWHHRGRALVYAHDLAWHRATLGPALSEGSVPFRAAFGDDDILYAVQARLLQLAGEADSLAALGIELPEALAA